eukprot:CAMPEP_0178465076 /NCGR_PEP_ID=MMETSP0689_2-20121128/51171_1 /TAXON_ID=160604 /ORGANISM="Amphidinium massartii, Strain CS-259" /LENGTH=579 /DNA_ID=CAMNT_0020091997 /DNA_START=56 /DNA_END=1791 /DNA_ORIENTATION=+
MATMSTTEVVPFCEHDHHSCSQLPEVELQTPIAVDALANVLLFIFFFNVALMTHARGKLRSPTKALGRLLLVFIKDYFVELWHTIKTIPSMGNMPLAARLRCCGNIDKAISVVSTCVPLFAITRFLNIGNVNGARWVGYALTCPFMQMELIILIAPIVPCYAVNAILTFLVTFACLGAGWVSSVMSGPLYDGLIGDFMETLDIHVLQINPKGMVVMPAMIGMACIGVLQVPWLATLYSCRGGGERREDMPDNYRLMLVTVIVTWMLFPLWWLFSWEGASFFKDAKLNEMGFMILNMIAKGTFIYQSSRMSQKFEEKYPEKMAEEFSECPSVVSPRHSIHRRRNSALIHTLERFTSDGHKIVEETCEGGIQDILAEIEQGVSQGKSETLTENFYQFEASECLNLAKYRKEAPDTEQMLQDILAAMTTFKEQLAVTKKSADEALARKTGGSSDPACASEDASTGSCPDRQHSSGTSAASPESPQRTHQRHDGSAETQKVGSDFERHASWVRLESIDWENLPAPEEPAAAEHEEPFELNMDEEPEAQPAPVQAVARDFSTSRSSQLLSCLPIVCRSPEAFEA